MDQKNIIAGVEFPHFTIKMSQAGMELIHQLNHFFEYEEEYNNWIQSKLKTNTNLNKLQKAFESSNQEAILDFIKVEDIPFFLENLENIQKIDEQIKLLPEAKQDEAKAELEKTKIKLFKTVIQKIANNEDLHLLSDEDKDIDQNYQSKIRDTKFELLQKILSYFEKENTFNFLEKTKAKFGWKKYRVEKFSLQDITDLIFAIANDPRNSFTRVQGFLARTQKQKQAQTSQMDILPKE
jgi:hypothetical protein